MDNENIGNLIAKLRKEKNMSQKDLADKLNITDKAVSKWERGISCPDINTIPKLSQILGVTSEELLCMKDRGKKTSIKELINLILKAIGLAMGISVFILSILNNINTKTGITLLALGITCISISILDNDKNSI